MAECPKARDFSANQGKFSQAGCRPARKFNAEWRKKIRRLGVLTFFKQGLFVLPGFQKRTDVCLQDFSVSRDGTAVTVRTSLTGSMGFIRAIETEPFGGEIHCSFYRAFGGLSSGFGAKNTFDIQVDDSADSIYFDRGTSPGILVLERDADTGAWAPVYPHLPQS